MLSAVRKQGISCDLLIPAIVTIEASFALMAGMLSAGLVAGMAPQSSTFEIAVLGTTLGTVVLIACLRSAETYSSRSLSLQSHLPLRVMSIAAAVCLAAGFAVDLLSAGLDWRWSLAWSLMTALALGLNRMTIVPAIRSTMPPGGFDKRIAVVGTGAESEEDLKSLHRELSVQLDRGCILKVVSRPDDIEGAGEHWVQELHADGVEEVIFLPSLHSNREWIHQAARALEILPVRVSLAIPRPAVDSNQPGYVLAALIDQPLTASERAIKRLFDATVSFFLIILLAPLMLLTAVLIKLDSAGPVLFKQQRYGFGKEIINVYKFRSMHHKMSDHLAERLTERDDPRVTRIGAFIRRFSIDELPQLFNVLGGDMSMVGPRPNPLHAKAGGELYDRVVDNFYTRYRVLPGITGWAQVNGLRGNTDTKDKLVRRVQYDLYYIRHWSFWLDLKIVLLTPLVSLEGENAF